MLQHYRKLLLLLISPLWLYGQDSTHLVNTSVKFSTEYDIDHGLSYRNIDTGSQRLEIFNPQVKKLTVYQDLGNIGTPTRGLLFNLDRQTGFEYSINPLDVYFLKASGAEFLNTKSPYTDITYVQGSTDLLILKLRHAQNILPRWNAGVDFQRITSLGFFLRQYTSMYNYRFFTSYHSRDKRYGILTHATWNRSVSDESGGITSDSSYEALTGSRKKVFVQLMQSETRIKHRVGYLKQYYRWGKANNIYRENDTLYDFTPRFQVSHSLQAEEISYIFTNAGDTDIALFPHQYYDTETATFDSTYYGKLRNTLQFEYFGDAGPDSSKGYVTGSFAHELINVSQLPFIRSYNNLIGELAWKKINGTDHLTDNLLKFSYDLIGYNSGDYRVDAFMRFKSRWAQLYVHGILQEYRPDFSLQLYKSNAFIWNNHFDKINLIKGTIGISTASFRNNFNLIFNLFNLANWIYIDNTAVPAQLNSDLQVIRIELNKTFRVGRLFFEHRLFYQKSNSDKVRLPEISGIIRYYYQSTLFKVMHYQVGFDVFYNSAYYSNAYNPANRQFYLQDEIKTGNYPVVDPFVVADIKRASLFVKYEHVNQDLFKTGMYSTPHYPLSLASLRFGVRWRLYN